MTVRSTPTLACLAAMLLAAPPALAQIAGLPRTVQGLFGAGGTSSRGQSLDFVVSAAEGYDTDLIVDETSSDGFSGGYSTVLNGYADYALRTRPATLRATLSSEMRYYPDLREFRSVGSRAGIGLFTSLPGRNTLFLNQTVAYSPSYYYGFSPRPGEIDVGDAATDDVDLATIDDLEAQYRYRTSLRLAHTLTRRSSLIGRADYGFTDFEHESDRRLDTGSLLVEGGYAWLMAQNTSANIAYRYRTTDVRDAVLTARTEHGVNFVLNHERVLSATRRAVFGFRVGSSTTEAPFAAEEGELLLGRRYWVHAELRASVPISRAWYARALYTRSMEYVGTLDPVFADRVRAGIDGFLGRRVTMSGALIFASGASSLDNLFFKTYTGTVEAHVALTRGLAAYGNYRYYFYDYGGDLADIPSDTRRNSVRLGLVLWVPALGR